MKNFAGQPDGGGQITILTGRELTTDVRPSDTFFQKRPLFVPNCKNCDMNNFKNFDDYSAYADYSGYSGEEVGSTGAAEAEKGGKGGFWSGLNLGTILDVGKTGVGIWASGQERKSAEQQAQAALAIERQRLQQEQLRARTEEAKASSVAGKVKAYALPIAITGVVVVAGIAAYFYFKKKPVS